MHSEVEKLLKLQGFDGRLEILRQELQTRPRLVAAQDGRVSDIAARSEELAAQILEKKKLIDRVELDVKSQDAKITDSQGKVTIVKSNEEYTVLMGQISRFEGEKGELEERLLVLWDEMEALEAERQSAAKELVEAREVLSEEQQTIDAESSEIRTEAGRLLEGREAARSGMDVEVLETYDLLFSRYRERSVVSADGGVCSGCHISLNPQTINLLRQDREIVTCKDCSRILYL